MTREPADDDADVFGNAWPLVAEWRELKAAHPNRGGGLDWLATQERLLTVELTLLEDPRHDAAPGDVPAAGLRAGRADQLAQDRTLRHAESAAKAGASAQGYVRTLALVAGAGRAAALQATLVNDLAAIRLGGLAGLSCRSRRCDNECTVWLLTKVSDHRNWVRDPCRTGMTRG